MKRRITFTIALFGVAIALLFQTPLLDVLQSGPDGRTTVPVSFLTSTLKREYYSTFKDFLKSQPPSQNAFKEVMLATVGENLDKIITEENACKDDYLCSQDNLIVAEGTYKYCHSCVMTIQTFGQRKFFLLDWLDDKEAISPICHRFLGEATPKIVCELLADVAQGAIKNFDPKSKPPRERCTGLELCKPIIPPLEESASFVELVQGGSN